MSVNFYSKSNSTSSKTVGFDQLSCDINLRTELTKILNTEGRGITVLYRKVQFDSLNRPVKCICWDDLTLEPDIDTQCKNCRGVGYVFHDYMVRGYRSQAQGYSASRTHKDQGKEQSEFRTFFFEYNVISSKTDNSLDIPSIYDKIIELDTDIEGVILSPLKQLIKYDIISVDPYRLEEGGRIEYYRVRAKASLEGSVLI